MFSTLLPAAADFRRRGIPAAKQHPQRYFEMKCAELIETETAEAPTTNTVRLPMGLLGFEQIKDYVLLSNPSEEPFAWLQVEANAALAFVVIDPFVVLPGYQPDIPQSDVDFLGLKSSKDALLLGIVTVQGSDRATVNLKGPVVINRHTHIGKQVIIANATDYPVQHPLPVAGTVA
jgi:flagellar assembly factor FliW